MTKTTFLIVAFTLSALMLSACAAKPAASSLAGTSWHLVSYGPVDSQTDAADGIDTQVDFSDDGKVSGTMGCNRFSGNYHQQDGKITFGPLMATKMACPELPMTQESVAFGVMVGTVKSELEADQMTLFSADGTIKIVLKQN